MPQMHVLSHCAGAPKYSWSKGQPKPRTGERKFQTPGPGSYEGESGHVKYSRPPGHGFEGSQRYVDRPATAPGPGAYTPLGSARERKTASHQFGKAMPRARSASPETPGPGTYQASPKIGVEGPKFSAGTRRDIPNGTPSPGPAAYELVEHHATSKARTPQHSFGRKPRQGGRTSTSPGPGAYEDIHGNVKERPKDYSFGASAGRKELSTGMQPGPGTYDHSPRIGAEGPKYSAGIKPARPVSHRSMAAVPGPGAYDGDANTHKYAASQKFGFGTLTRDRSSEIHAPGPGTYDHTAVDGQRPNSPRHGFGSSTRVQVQSRTKLNSPGPGAYEAKERIGKESASFTVGGKPKTDRPIDAPGPGAYEHGVGAQPLSPRYGFGSSTRGSTHKPGSPGPGAYGDKPLNKGQHFSMGQRNPVPNLSNTPGPGGYDHTSIF
jgi:hypothetical protein